MHFGNHRQERFPDFLIPPFALFYCYTVLASTLNLPLASTQEFFPFAGASWAGVLLCLAGLVLLFLSLVSFGKRFRVGIDQDPARTGLVTTGVSVMSRNLIYVAFWLVLLGQFPLFSNWILLVYLAAATWLFHSQVRREEGFMSRHYGQEYSDYCARVRTYL